MADIEFNNSQMHFSDRMTKVYTSINEQIELFEKRQHDALKIYTDLFDALIHGPLSHSDITTERIDFEGHRHMEEMHAYESEIINQFSSFMKDSDQIIHDLEYDPDSKAKLIHFLEVMESSFRTSMESWEKTIARFEAFIEDIKNSFFRLVCMNCNNTYIYGDKYCRYCGAPMGTPIFIVDVRECIYGPKPVIRTHVCSECGYSWENCVMIDRERWCPMCGGKVKVSGDLFSGLGDLF